MLTRTHIRSALRAMLAMATLLVCVPNAAAAESESLGFGVAPLRFDVDISAGQSSNHSITITNTDTVPVAFTFRKVDIQGDKKDPDATPVLLPGKYASGVSGYDWLGLPDSVTIGAGESQAVKVKVTAPAGSTGGHFAAVIVSGSVKGAGNVKAQSAWAIPFLINAGGSLPPDIVITETTKVGPNTTRTIYYNPSKDAATTPVGDKVTVDPVTGEEIDRTPLVCTTALPKGSGSCTEESSSAAPGTTVADESSTGITKPYVDLGDPGTAKGDRARANLPTEWAGTWTSMLLPLVGIAMFVMYFLFLRRRRKNQEDGDLAFEG